MLGGDCTIGIGSVAGCITEFERTALIYFDLHPDLNVPGAVDAGALDWMGSAHMLGVDGADEVVASLGPRRPLLTPGDVLYFAYGPGNRTKFEASIYKELELHGIDVDEVKADPLSAAGAALKTVDEQHEAVALHFDVDVIDFLDAPLSENTGHNEGLAFDIAMKALEGLMRCPRLKAITITELNPDHGEDDMSTARIFVQAFAYALRAALSPEPI